MQSIFNILIQILSFEISDFAIWNWEDEKGRWNPYSLDTCEKLEDQYQAPGQFVKVSAYKRAYTIDLLTMKQANDATGVERKVKREIVKG